MLAHSQHQLVSERLVAQGQQESKTIEKAKRRRQGQQESHPKNEHGLNIRNRNRNPKVR